MVTVFLSMCSFSRYYYYSCFVDIYGTCLGKLLRGKEKWEEKQTEEKTYREYMM